MNALIDLVQAKPLGGSAGPGDDLFGAPKQAPAPMPRLRAPGGTSQLQLHDVPPSKVRMMTAPTNGGAIPSIKSPPLPRSSRPSATVPPPRPAGTPAPQLSKPAPAPHVSKPAPAPQLSKPAPAPQATSTLPPPQPKSTLPPPRAAGAPAPQMKSAPVPQAVPRVTSAPVPRPVPQPPSRPIEAKRVEAISPNGNPFAAMPTFAPPPRPSLDMTGDIVASESWFEASRAVEKFDDETFVGTAPVVKLERRRKLAVLKIVGTSVVFVVIGVVIGAYIAFHGDKTHTAIAHATPASPAKAPVKTVVQPMPVPQEAAAAPLPTTPKLADVRIDSTPPGATVTLVDGDKTSVLGTTPLATSLDPSRGYDVVLAAQGRPSKQVHLDVASTPHLEIALDKPAPAPAATPAPAPAPEATPPHETVAATPVHHRAATAARSAPVGQIADPGFDSFGGNGTLMVSTKPPCEIEVDGKATGMRTPQRAMALSAGAHKITFVNAAEHINKTISVSISADHTTKLIKDLLN
ncbi:MAG TPA: hypothetical protein VGL61_08285 [Kofleriaceae bacterium]